MPAPLAVDKEQVRMLVLDHGPREAARMCNLAEGTVLYWCATEKWLEPTRAKPATLPQPASMARSSDSIKPAQAKADRMLRERDATATAMSHIALTTAVAARNASLRIETPADLLALANAHAKIHRLESQALVGVQINLGRGDVG